MKLELIDILIIILYFVLTIGLGVYFTRRASKNLDSYFLGGRRMPWFILSVSNASGMYDISGTMWLVSMLFIYGLKGIWFPWLWPFFNQVFMMVYLSVWLRRSNVMTGAEWITTRFGSDAGAKQSHIIVVVFALVSVIGFLSYAFVGIGKFAQTLLPWDISANAYAVILMLVTGLYVIMGGMFSVVATDVFQFIIMTITSLIIGILAMILVSPEALAAVTPDNWDRAIFSWKLDLDWTGIIDPVNDRIASDGTTFFAAFVMMMLFKGIFISAAGPIPSHDMQRILSNRTPRHAAMMSGMNSVILMIPRFMLVAGLTVLALVFFSPELTAMGRNIDLELILPIALGNFIPAGLKGLVIAGLLAAFMSTIASFINVAPAYLVNDIYKKYIKPEAGNRRLVAMSYLASALVLAAGIGFGFVVQTVDSITKWIVTALWAGYAAPNMLKWYWWRFNGHGFFWGMFAGLLAALVTPRLMPGLTQIWHFPFVFLISLAACFIASLATKPEKEELLIKFYSNVRPWGFWKPVHDMVIKKDPGFKKNTGFRRDMFNVAIGIIWQLCIIALPVYLVIEDFSSVAIVAGVILATSWILKKNWLDRLE
jgi:SSS family solute:Na+ symporter